ncbi:MAG: TMEM175 family protein [Alphaproteobacteria bacterium]|nr:TMEM175 family protein [Alphaproteobacteria bacterium]
MEKERLAAFSDGVIAVIITIMVLELKPPQGSDFAALRAMAPSFLNYVLSFIYVAIYWNNHHHMLSTARRVNGAVLWANMHLLFWLALIPLTTEWVRQSFAELPTAIYGAVLLFCALAYYLLQTIIIHTEGTRSVLAKAVGSDIKGKMSPVLYALGIGLSFWSPLTANFVYAFVALMWLVPDRRIEKVTG